MRHIYTFHRVNSAYLQPDGQRTPTQVLISVAYSVFLRRGDSLLLGLFSQIRLKIYKIESRVEATSLRLFKPSLSLSLYL